MRGVMACASRSQGGGLDGFWTRRRAPPTAAARGGSGLARQQHPEEVLAEEATVRRGLAHLAHLLHLQPARPERAQLFLGVAEAAAERVAFVDLLVRVAAAAFGAEGGQREPAAWPQ